MGSGEWNAHKYKASKNRRDWRKLHIGVDEDGFIVAAELTTSGGDRASTVPDLLDQIEDPIWRFTADGPTTTGRSTSGSAQPEQRMS